MSYIDVLNDAATRANQASDKAESASDLLHDIVNGPIDTYIPTDNGQVPTAATAINELQVEVGGGAFAPQAEKRILSAGQVNVSFNTIETSGVSLYINEGSGAYRYFDFTVDGTNSVVLDSSFPDGTIVWGVAQEIGGEVGTAVQQTQANMQASQASANAAAISEDNAGDSEVAAKASENAAAISEDNAKTSEINAKASEVAAANSQGIASNAATSASNDAGTARVDALQAKHYALKAAEDGSALFGSVSEGLLNTAEGRYFKVPEGKFIQLYQKVNEEEAFKVLKIASEESVRDLSKAPDPMLTSLIFG